MRLVNKNLAKASEPFFDQLYCLSFKEINRGAIDPVGIYCLSSLKVFVSAPFV